MQRIDWDLIKTAYDMHVTQPAAAETLLTMALGMESHRKSGMGETPEPDKSVFYGKGGYTDVNDPREPDCQSHQFDGAGKPLAIHLGVMVRPSSKYRCSRVELLQNDESCNVYVIVTNKSGGMVPSVNTRMITGWRESDTDYDSLIEAPASPGSFFMGRDSKFYPPSLGPIGACVIDDSGNIDSDLVGSMGLSKGQHWSFRVYFQER